MRVIGGDMIDKAGFAAMRVGAAKFGRGDNLAGRGLHQRRPSQKNRTLALSPLPRTITVSSLIAGT